MLYRSLTYTLACIGLLLATQPVAAQDNIAAIVAKHLTTSRDFTLKVADQMPEADYGFKLTAAQMSFAEQMVHLAEDQGNLLGPLFTEKLAASKPASMSKKDVMTYVRQQFDRNIALVSTLTPAQISKVYSLGGPMTGLELLMFTLDHTTHHRASAEMYLRAKGIKPADYQF
jgi:uncharacterized damage-inducible protein DinB